MVMRIQTAMRRRIRWKIKLSRQPNQTTNITTKHHRTRRVINWIGIPKVRKNLLDSVTGRGYYKPESSRFKKVVRKTMFEKKPPRRDRNIRTPFRDKARDHSTERLTGAAPVATVGDNLDIWRESVRTHHRRTLLNLQPRIFLARRCFCTVA